MINYAEKWKKKVNLIQSKYNDFISDVKIKDAFYIQKVDGLLGALIYKNGEIFLQSITGQIIKNIPLLEECKIIFDSKKIKDIVLISELVAIINSEIAPFNKTVSIVRTPNIGDNKNLIHNFIFDVLEYEGKEINDYFKAIKIIRYILKDKKKVRIHIPKIYSGDLSQFKKLFDETKDKKGFDGIVVRQRSGKNYKIKNVLSFDVVIIGAGNKKMISWGRNEISYLLAAFIDSEGNYRSTSRIGTGFSRKDRQFFFDFITKNKIYETEEEIFTKPKIVIEIDILDYTLKDLPRYKIKGNNFKLIDYKESATLRHPRMIRIRSDKKPTYSDVSIDQLLEVKK